MKLQHTVFHRWCWCQLNQIEADGRSRVDMINKSSTANVAILVVDSAKIFYAQAQTGEIQ